MILEDAYKNIILDLTILKYFAKLLCNSKQFFNSPEISYVYDFTFHSNVGKLALLLEQTFKIKAVLLRDQNRDSPNVATRKVSQCSIPVYLILRSPAQPIWDKQLLTYFLRAVWAFCRNTKNAILYLLFEDLLANTLESDLASGFQKV